MSTLVFYLIFIIISVWTLAMLPFINIDAALWLQMKIQELERWAAEKERELDE